MRALGDDTVRVRKLRSGNYAVRLVITPDFMRVAERIAERQPLIGGPAGYLRGLLNMALLSEELRLEEADIRQEKLEGRYNYNPPEFDPDGDVPF